MSSKTIMIPDMLSMMPGHRPPVSCSCHIVETNSKICNGLGCVLRDRLRLMQQLSPSTAKDRSSPNDGKLAYVNKTNLCKHQAGSRSELNILLGANADEKLTALTCGGRPSPAYAAGRDLFNTKQYAPQSVAKF
jgi:hypothetical protein